jgi:hypothetical protein
MDLNSSNILNLYRGDDLNNDRTKPAIYRSEGIVSGAFGNFGDPLNIERIGFLETIKQHIDHLKDYEKSCYAITDYISFSEDEGRAKDWASRMHADDLIVCNEPYLETRCIFHVKIPFGDLKPIAEGVWTFAFSCNPNRKTPSKLNSDEAFETIALEWALSNAGCGVCNASEKKHSLIVVNPRILMEHFIGLKKYNRVNKLIAKNSEWLLLPNDIVNFGCRGTRIQVADFWDVQGYVMKNEMERNPYVLPYLDY